MKGLGRRYAPDPRDAAYPMRSVLPVRSDRTYRYWWDSGAWLDQGSTGTCVGHGGAHWCEDSPITPPGTIDPIQLYRECTLLDEWPENDDGDLNFGTSVRALMKALQARGLIDSYWWGLSMDDVITALLDVTLVIVGTVWMSGMDRPDENDLIHATGSVRGGHCYVLNGVNLQTQRVRVKNSWGRYWGEDGRARIGFDDLEWLLFGADGEAAIALQKK